MLKSKPKQSEQILRQFGITFLSDIRTRLNILAKKACYLSRNLTVAIDAEDNRGCKGWLIKMVLLKMRCFVLKKKSFPHFDVLHWDCLFVFVCVLFIYAYFNSAFCQLWTHAANKTKPCAFIFTLEYLNLTLKEVLGKIKG